jgi:D-threonate/D-erythronate kinase
MKRLRILADDVTGALDTAAAFAMGASVPVHLQEPEDDDAPVAACVTDTRDIAAAALPARLASAGRWLADAETSFKKVDSLLRGNSLAEVAELLRQGRFERVVFAPAYPAQRRITQAGRQWVRSADGTCRAVGPESIVAAFASLGIVAASARDADAQVWAPDVADDAELAHIVALHSQPNAQRWLWCGSAGLAFALAHTLAPATAQAAPADGDGDGPTLTVTASHHPVLRAQVQRLRDSGACLVFDGSTLHRAAAAHREGRNVMIDLSLHDTVAPEAAAAALHRHAAELIDALPRPARALVIGGDSLLALCRAAGTRVLHAHASPRPGWGLARLDGGRWDGTRVLSRSGAFGDADDLITAITGTNTRHDFH